MPAGRPKSIDNSKVFDVAKPGRSKPLSTSRPVVINQNDTVNDDTVKVADVDSNKSLSPPSVSRKIIRPLFDQTEPAEPSEDTAVTVTTAPQVKDSASVDGIKTTAQDPVAAKVKNFEPETEPVKEGSQPDKVSTSPLGQDSPADQSTSSTPAGDTVAEAPTEPAAGTQETSSSDVKPEGAAPEAPAVSETASVDALAEASEKNKESSKELEEQAKREAALQEMIDSKKYVVPLAHDSTQKSGSTFMVIILFVVIVLAAGTYLAIDKKVIDLGINLPYHFFAQ